MGVVQSLVGGSLIDTSDVEIEEEALENEVALRPLPGGDDGCLRIELAAEWGGVRHVYVLRRVTTPYAAELAPPLSARGDRMVRPPQEEESWKSRAGGVYIPTKKPADHQGGRAEQGRFWGQASKVLDTSLLLRSGE